MTRLRLLPAVCVLAAVLVGCGGPEDAIAPPTPPDDGGNAAPVQVGPMLVRPAAAAGFVAEAIAGGYGPVTLVALHGSRINYLASLALLDRIVFSRGSGTDYDICVCNLDGSGAVKLIDNTAADEYPTWAPDGGRVAFQRKRVGEDTEIVVMNANGSGAYALTSNSAEDTHPTWSPEGRRIAFQTDRDVNNEVYVMYDDGSGQTNLTNNAASDGGPAWSHYGDNLIYFTSHRDGGDPEIYRMREDGSSQIRTTNRTGSDTNPTISRADGRIAWESVVQGALDIMAAYSDGSSLYALSAAPGLQQLPAWSSDGRFICYCEWTGADWELVLQQTDPPYDRFVLTDNAPQDLFPDLGSPTMQTDRVIIGPSGSDWGGRNPIWSSCDAGIAAYDERGYRSFVRIAVRQADLPSLRVSPLSQPTALMAGPGSGVAGALVEANEIVSLREDAGRGRQSILWQLDPLDATAAVLYFSTWTGKLLAVMTIADQNYPSAAGAPAGVVSQRADGDAMLVEGAFGAVFDATGARVADAAAAVRIGDDSVAVVR